MPLAVLGFAGSVIGIVFEEAVYGQETPNWAWQAVGQDLANLIAFPVLVLLALAALGGSLRAYLAWAGLVAYSVYTYAIYAFAVQFGPLFLLWVAVLGLSVYTLIGGLASLEPARVRASFRSQPPVRSAAGLLLAIGVVFGLLWLSEIIPAALAGTTPPALTDTGLATNPVHVLDLAVLLPAAILSGVRGTPPCPGRRAGSRGAGGHGLSRPRDRVPDDGPRRPRAGRHRGRRGRYRRARSSRGTRRGALVARPRSRYTSRRRTARHP